MVNARAWLVWIAAALAVALLATNPLYLVIVLLCAALVRAGYGTNGSSLPVWRFGLLVVAFSTFYNALLTHFGSTVLFTIPRTVPLVGGLVTLEAAAFGATRGLALWTLFAVMAVLNDVISPYELVRLTPRFLRSAGLVVSIMLAFVPQTINSLHQVREAQAIRGHRLRGVRDLIALLVPLLADSLERAVQLAEAMEARGYGNTEYQISNFKPQVLMGGGLSGVLLGWLIEAYWRNGIGWAIVGVSVAALVVGLRLAAAYAPQMTRYRRQVWSARDTLLVALSSAPLVAIAAVALLASQALAFYPYPQVTLPPFDVRLGVCLALLGAPAFFNVGRAAPRVEHSTLHASRST